jgi:hypothetical protein
VGLVPSPRDGEGDAPQPRVDGGDGSYRWFLNQVSLEGMGPRASVDGGDGSYTMC